MPQQAMHGAGNWQFLSSHFAVDALLEGLLSFSESVASIEFHIFIYVTR